MKARLSFGFPGLGGSFDYSSRHWFQFFVFADGPHLGHKMRFQVPVLSDEGRWVKDGDNYFPDESDWIEATIVNVVNNVSVETPTETEFLHVELPVDVSGLLDGPGCEQVMKCVERLVDFQRYRQTYERLANMAVDDPELHFTPNQIQFLNGKGYTIFAHFAGLTIDAFHKRENRMVKSIDKKIKELLGYGFCAMQPG